MAGLILDIETDNLLDKLTKIHCIAVRDEQGGEVRSFGGHNDATIRAFLTHLEDAPLLIGHNIIDYDLRALKKVYPNFKPRGKAWDTLLDSQTMWTDLRDLDFTFARKHPDFPKKLIGRHKLEAWGYRLGEFKGKVEGEKETKWEKWTPELQAYCEQDVRVTALLYEKIKSSERFSQQAHDLEHWFKPFMIDQETEGFPFDEKGAKELYAELASERAQLEANLQAAFPPWEETTKRILTPKRNNATKGYFIGVPVEIVKTKTVTFNPRSHDHIADRLKTVRGWAPMEFTETGKAQTDGDTIEALAKEWPECADLARHIEIQKIIGMVAEGKSAYLKLVSPDGRLRGRVATCGTVTGRCAHKEPNLGNIPRRSALGKRVRKLFTTIPGYSLVGCDAKGLELRMLAHFLAKFDGGKYVLVVCEGDPHEFHRQLAGLDTRDQSKTFIYAFVYGGGDGKIGLIVGKSAAAGRKLRLTFLKRFPALSKLKDAVQYKAKGQGWIKGLDGRRLHCRAVYSSLNTLLQSAGALVMKAAVCLFNEEVKKRGWQNDVRQVAFVHDEIQVLVREGLEKEVQDVAVSAIKRAGEYFSLRCPTDGDSRSGLNWGETH